PSWPAADRPVSGARSSPRRSTVERCSTTCSSPSARLPARSWSCSHRRPPAASTSRPAFASSAIPNPSAAPSSVSPPRSERRPHRWRSWSVATCRDSRPASSGRCSRDSMTRAGPTKAAEPDRGLRYPDWTRAQARINARTRRVAVPQLQAMWAKLNANERLVTYGAIIVLIAWLVSLVGGGGLTYGFITAIIVLVIYWLKYAPNQTTTWPLPVQTLVLIITGISAILVLIALL